MSESECGKSGHLSISAFLKHLMMLSYGVIIFQGFIFTPYQRHMIACRVMQLFFWKFETLLNKAFIVGILVEKLNRSVQIRLKL